MAMTLGTGTSTAGRHPALNEIELEIETINIHLPNVIALNSTFSPGEKVSKYR
jgi:hypothetical protein